MPSKTKEVNEENSKKNIVKKASNISKKSSIKKTPTAIKKVAVKKITKNKKISTAKNSKATKKTALSLKKEEKQTISPKKTITPNQKSIPQIIEYYDLPYRYNETIVKVLYQTLDTLFVYWDISDSDRENYIKQYGENFFNITRPVLIVHNDTMNYSFEIPIDDFANSWYLHINDSKCHYRLELGRRPNYYSHEAAKQIEEKIKTDYIYVTSSNKIESPNDRVLFNTNQNNTIKFRNLKNYEEKSVSLYDIVKHLPIIKKEQNIPYISEELLSTLYAGIYQNEDIKLFEQIRNNPSSGGNPSSGSLSSRFI